MLTKNAAKLKQTEGRERGRPDNVNINLTMQRLKKYVCKKRTKTMRNGMESKEGREDGLEWNESEQQNKLRLISKRFMSTQKGFKHIFMWNCQVY